MKSKNEKILKLTDIEMLKKIKGNKNISYQRLKRFLATFLIILRKTLIENKEITFGNFVKLGPRIAKDRMVTTRAYGNIPSEKKHMPKHLRFKAYFRQEFKEHINNDK